MLKDRLLCFLKNEDGHVVTYPVDVAVVTASSMVLTYRLALDKKVPEKWAHFISFAVAGCVLFLSILWGIKNYYGAESTLLVVEGILAVGALAGIMVYKLAEYIWKVPKSGMVSAWITAICIIVPCLRYVFRIKDDGAVHFDQDGDTDAQEITHVKSV